MLTSLPAIFDRNRSPSGSEIKEAIMNIASPTNKGNFFHAAALCGSSLMKISEPAVITSEQLMPYGAVAKTIFVKANGLTAYHKAFCCENLYCPEKYEQASA